MGDNLANEWGCQMVLLERKDLKRKYYDDSNVDKGKNLKTAFLRTVETDLDHKFFPIKVTANGSDANLYAVSCVTTGSNEGCLIAAGSYVSGDSGPLQNWSTTQIAHDYGLCLIVPPEDAASEFTQRQTTPLPYHIPGTMSESDLIQYEDECMQHLHFRCLVQGMKSVPITLLLMEITLAGNGATLSDRSLCMLGQLAKLHGFKIVVDEIMTGGRTGTMLLTMQKPEQFTQAVAYVTMGKWLSVGLVLANKDEKDRLITLSDGMVYRGASTDICCLLPGSNWRAVKDSLHNTPSRRTSVLKQLRVAEDDAWGQGAHIFCPIRRNDHAQGLKNRFLPMLNSGDIMKFKHSNKRDWNKDAINKKIVAGCRLWLTTDRYLGSQEHLDYHKLTDGLLSHFHSTDWFSSEWVAKRVLRDGHTVKSASAAMRAAEKVGMVSKVVKTSQRLRGWKMNNKILPPWRCPDDEHPKSFENK